MSANLEIGVDLKELDRQLSAAMGMTKAFGKAAEKALQITVKKSSEGLKKVKKSGDLIGDVIKSTTPKIQKLETQLAKLRRETSKDEKGTNRYKKAVIQLNRAIEKARIANDGALRTQRKLTSEYRKSLTPLGRLKQDLNELSKMSTAGFTATQKAVLAQTIMNKKRQIAAKQARLQTSFTQKLTIAMSQQTSVMVSQMSPGLSGVMSIVGKLNPATIALTAAIAATVGAMAKAASASIKMESALAVVQNKMGLAGRTTAEAAKQMRMATDAIIDAGISSKFSGTEAASGFEALVTRGFDASQAMNSLSDVLKFATALNLDLSLSAKVAASSMASYKNETTSLADRLGMLAKVTSLSGIQQEDLEIALGNSAKGAIAARQRLDEMLTVMRFARTAGVDMSTVSTGVGNALLKMSAKAKDGAISIAGTSVAIVDATGRFRKFGDIIQDISVATQGLSDDVRASAITEVFGERSITPILAMLDKLESGIVGVDGSLKTGSEALAEFRKQLEGGADELDRQSENIAKTVTGRLDIISGQIDTFFTLLGRGTEGPIASFLGAIQDINQAIIDWQRADFGLIVTMADSYNLLGLIDERLTISKHLLDANAEEMDKVASSADAMAAAIDRIRAAELRHVAATANVGAEMANISGALSELAGRYVEVNGEILDSKAPDFAERLKESNERMAAAIKAANEAFVEQFVAILAAEKAWDDYVGMISASIAPIEVMSSTIEVAAIPAVSDLRMEIDALSASVIAASEAPLTFAGAMRKMGAVASRTMSDMAHSIGAGIGNLTRGLANAFSNPVSSMQTIMRLGKELFELTTGVRAQDITAAFRRGEDPTVKVDEQALQKEIDARVKAGIFIATTVANSLPEILASTNWDPFLTELTVALGKALWHMMVELGRLMIRVMSGRAALEYIARKFGWAIVDAAFDALDSLKDRIREFFRSILDAILPGKQESEKQVGDAYLPPGSQQQVKTTGGDGALIFQPGGPMDPRVAAQEQTSVLAGGQDEIITLLRMLVSGQRNATGAMLGGPAAAANMGT